jgi:hypothetical protein
MRNLLEQTNYDTRDEIAEALGFITSANNVRFQNELRMIAPLAAGWDVTDAVLAYLDHIRQRHETRR